MIYPGTELKEKIISSIIISAATVSSLLLLAMLLFILRESWPIWSQIGVSGFLSGSSWRPLNTPPEIGILSMIVSTVWVAGGALLIAAPLGFGCAIFLAEFAPDLWQQFCVRL